MERFLLNPAPLLERLQISRSQGATLESPTLATVDLLGGQAESLKELSIRSFPISWQSPLLRQVEVLSIEGRGLNIKLQQLVEILRHNFKLRDLSFDANDVEVDEGFTPDDTLALPNLERVHIPEATPVLIELVLTRLDAPRCTYISIGVTNQPFFSAEIYRRGFRAIETRLRNSLATGPISTVQLYKTRSRNLRAVWEVPGLNTPEAPKLNLRFSGWLAGSGCAWFRDLLGEVGRQVRLRVEPDSDPWSQEDLALIGTFTMVGSILLITKTSTWPFVPILFLLSRSFKTEDGITLRQNFPQLHEIVVRYSEGIDMRLREAIQERYDPERLSGVEGAPSLTLDLRPSHALTEADWNVGRLFVGLRGVEAVTMRGVAVKSV
ncbi:hypothetical protein FRB90_006053 [Tulasnella sp. 427]|nr:hypothetical protein FRB90_006053 [Tulasnella sp. 427]